MSSIDYQLYISSHCSTMRDTHVLICNIFTTNSQWWWYTEIVTTNNDNNITSQQSPVNLRCPHDNDDIDNNVSHGVCLFVCWSSIALSMLCLGNTNTTRPRCSQWCRPRDQGLGLEAPRGQKWKSWSWIMKSWSWSWTFGLGLGLEQKVSQFFKQWARHTMAFCERQQKQFAIRKTLFERTFCAPCTSASVERVFNKGAIC